MKKGLLGILVIALTIVGCQNYDDQFDSLNDKIASLSSEVSSLKAIQTTVTALSTKLDELANSALSDEDLEEILKEVADVQSSVAAIEDVTTEVEDLNEEVDTILEKLGDILAANAFYDGNLTITNNGQLANAHELIKTDDDDPTLTVRGNVLVTVKAVGGVPLDSIASVQKILTKIRSVQGTVTITSEVAASLPALTYVTGDIDLVGGTSKVAANIAAEKLLTVDGNMSISGMTGVVAFPALGSVGTLTVTETASVATITTLNVGGLTNGTVQSSAGQLVLAKATNVHLGGTLPAVVNLAACVDFQHASGANQTALDLTLGGKAAVMSMGAPKFTGVVTITTTGNVQLPSLTEITTTTISLGTAKSEVHMPSLKTITGVVSVSAEGTVFDFSALKTVNADVNLHGPTVLSLPELAESIVSASVTITAPACIDFSAPKLSTASTTLSLKAAAAKVTVMNIANVVTPSLDITNFANLTDLTLTGQESNLDVSSGVKLVTLNFTGKQLLENKLPGEDVQNNSLTITAANSALKNLVLSADNYLGALTVSGSAIVNLTTDGYIINTDVKNNGSLESFAFGHTHVQGDRESTVKITGNAKVASVDLSSLSKVGTVSVTDNAKLESLTAPSIDVLATSLATITVNIYGNKLAGTYQAATAPTGTVTYSAPIITGATLSSFKAWINANANADQALPSGIDRTIAKATDADAASGSGVTNNAITYHMDLDEVPNAAGTKVTLSSLMQADTAATTGATGTNVDNDNDGAAGGGVTTGRELATVAD